MHCSYYESGKCRSCSLIELPSSERMDFAQAHTDALLGPYWADPTSPDRWRTPLSSPDSGFRNKAKMVAGGSANEPTLGILDAEFAGVDLRACPLYSPTVHSVLGSLPELIKRAQLPPYSVTRQRGELKHVLCTEGDGGQLMLRFVLRSEKPLNRLREHLPAWLERNRSVATVSANINPDHTSIIEGLSEHHLWGPATLPVTQGKVRLYVRPQSFLQTNTAVASQLYTTVSNWVDELHSSAPQTPTGTAYSVWDLYCGLGGFALHAATGSATTTRPRHVTGVELAPAAIESAKESARESGLTVTFVCADAAQWAALQDTRPDLLIVNPPRRGMGKHMSAWLANSGIERIIYSSCNPATLAQDLEIMGNYRAERSCMVDMFPHTPHTEVLTQLVRI